MPHRRRSLLRSLAGFAPAALIVIACSPDRSGAVVDSAAPTQPVERVDPAASLDREFQQARSALNEEARALAKLDRSLPEYTDRYEAWLRDAASAESLRARRDSLRRALPAASPTT